MNGISINDRVVIKPSIEVFHHQETPRFSLAPALAKLKMKQVAGIVRKHDPTTDSYAVLFPGKKEFLWFKAYELVRR